MSGSPAAARNVGSQSWCWTISFETVPAAILPGPADHLGNAERALPVRVLLATERGHAGVRPRVHVRPVVGRVDDDRVLGDPELVELVEQLADDLVVVDHRVVVGRLPAAGLAEALRLRVRAEVHVRGVEPDEERRPGGGLAVDEVGPCSSISSSIVSIRFFVSGPVSSIRCFPTRPNAAPRSRRPRPSPTSGCTPRGPKRSLNSGKSRPAGSPAAPAPPRRSGGRGCRRTRRSRARSAGTCSGRRGGSCRTGRWRSRAA